MFKCWIMSLAPVYSNMPCKTLYTRVRHLHNAPFTCSAWLINFPRTWGEQRTPSTWKRHPAHPFLFVLAQKSDQFLFAANGMQTIRRWRNKGSQSHLLICAFGSQTVREQFVNHSARSCIRGLSVTLLGITQQKCQKKCNKSF